LGASEAEFVLVEEHAAPLVVCSGLPWSTDVDTAVAADSWTDGRTIVVRTGVRQTTWAMHLRHEGRGFLAPFL
jgi:hypothetical protein